MQPAEDTNNNAARVAGQTVEYELKKTTKTPTHGYLGITGQPCEKCGFTQEDLIHNLGSDHITVIEKEAITPQLDFLIKERDALRRSNQHLRNVVIPKRRQEAEAWLNRFNIAQDTLDEIQRVFELAEMTGPENIVNDIAKILKKTSK